MLSAFRTPVLRQLSVLRAGARALPSAHIAAPLAPLAPWVRMLATAPTGTATRSNKKPGWTNVCMNCRREGHIRSECTEPTICVACGVEGHQRRDCPNPDEERLAALKTAPPQCFRCGEEHLIRDCPQPAKCYLCGSTEHKRTACPTYVPKPKPEAVSPEATVTPVVEA
ncbi:hypothetical protein C8R46DRAFT_1116049 [Mycena filopes]|nr:hypothetical protein C8R46DRAFT_1116049 [Mycena filopes]